MSSSPATPLPPSSDDRPARRLRLFRAWRAGDKRAGQALFRDLRADLVTRFRGCPSHVVEDLVQDTLVACVLARHALRHDEAFSSYVHRVVYRSLIHHRYRAREVILFDEDVAGGDRNTARIEDIIDARRLLCTCPSRNTIVVALRYLEGHHGVDVARMLQTSEASVRRRSRRGLDELRHAASGMLP